MYLQHFNFSEKPFSLTPDTQFFYEYQSHKSALNTLLVALNNSEGFIKVVGEVGTGKTLLGRLLLKKLNRSRFVSAYIPNPHVNPEELKLLLAKEIGVVVDANTPAYQLTPLINEQLIALAKKRKQVVLILDEAQTMPRETIEALRLLSNLETEKRKLLQIVMLGQPELDQLLNRNDLRQLKQRIVFSETLAPLNFLGLRNYVSFRLHSCGAAHSQLISLPALWYLYQASRGIPRLVNILCHKALLVAYSQGKTSVDIKAMQQAISDTSEVSWWSKLYSHSSRGKWWFAYAIAGLGGFLLTVAGGQ